MKLRFDVFVREQNSIYDEFDNLDQEALHFLIESNSTVIAYLRILQSGDVKSHIGRIVIHPEHRDKKLGKKIIEHAIDYIQTHRPTHPIEIGAQERLETYYEQFGFKTSSLPYSDGGVPHIKMTLEAIRQ